MPREYNKSPLADRLEASFNKWTYEGDVVPGVPLMSMTMRKDEAKTTFPKPTTKSGYTVPES